MRTSTISVHGGAADRFMATVHTDQSMPYVCLSIESDENDFSLFTPSGLTLSADYLREFRDAIDSALAELVQMEKNWELKIDDEKHEAQDREAEDA